VFADVVLGVIATATSDDRTGSDDDRLIDSIELLPAAHPLRRALAAVPTGVDRDTTQAWEELQTWFTNTTDRTSGWYRRHVRLLLVLIAVVVVGSLDLDTIDVTRALWLDDVTRAALVEEADELLAEDVTTRDGTAGDSIEASSLVDRVDRLEQDLDALATFGLELGWG
jgi:hypothetical protein